MHLWKKIIALSVLVGVLYLVGLGTIPASSNSTVPGSVDDPVVSKSYVDEQIARLRAELTGNISVPAPQPTPAPSSSSPLPTQPSSSSGMAMSLVVEELKAGQSLIGSEGTEMIVRTGKAVILTNQHGDGIPDLTAGKDLAGIEAPLNHLLLIPRSDGRGVKVTEGPCFVMIRGEYMIQ